MTEPDPDLWPHMLSAGTSEAYRDEAAEAMRVIMAGRRRPARSAGS